MDAAIAPDYASAKNVLAVYSTPSSGAQTVVVTRTIETPPAAEEVYVLARQ
jgi:hypothetical protein